VVLSGNLYRSTLPTEFSIKERARPIFATGGLIVATGRFAFFQCRPETAQSKLRDVNSSPNSTMQSGPVWQVKSL
jgi:hypothetical protein